MTSDPTCEVTPSDAVMMNTTAIVKCCHHYYIGWWKNTKRYQTAGEEFLLSFMTQCLISPFGEIRPCAAGELRQRRAC